MIPQILNDVVKYVINNGINFSTTSKDGRVNSIVSEPSVINLIKKGFNAESPEDRFWYDISVKDGDNVYYINIKCTTLLKGSADNISSLNGLVYALTGQTPIKEKKSKSARIGFLMKNIADTDKDYYFLIIGKDDISKSYVTSVKHLSYITPNGSNLPFQCSWRKNIVLSSRSFIDSAVFITDGIRKSIELNKKEADAMWEAVKE